jgi:hypothetical protein
LAERGAKGFSCWSQFVAMMFCRLAQAKSLREIIDGLACCEGKLRHLGLQRSPKRSIGVSFDEQGASVVKPFMSQLGMNYPVVTGNPKIVGDYGGITAIPTTFVIADP